MDQHLTLSDTSNAPAAAIRGHALLVSDRRLIDRSSQRDVISACAESVTVRSACLPRNPDRGARPAELVMVGVSLSNGRRDRSFVRIVSKVPGTWTGEFCMPDAKTIRKAKEDKREGKSPSTQAGEFVHEEISKIRQKKHGARSAKQAIAIGLSEARRAGVDLPPPKKGTTSKRTRRNAKYAYEVGQHKRKAKRRPNVSRAVSKVLKHEPTGTVSSRALSRQAKTASRHRSSSARSAAARKAARTKGPRGRSAAAKKAARTRKARSRR